MNLVRRERPYIFMGEHGKVDRPYILMGEHGEVDWPYTLMGEHCEVDCGLIHSWVNMVK